MSQSIRSRRRTSLRLRTRPAEADEGTGRDSHAFRHEPQGANRAFERSERFCGAGRGREGPFRFDRVLVATVAKGAKWDLGDRMIWTRVFVQPINFSFAGYSVAATDNETVKLTSVEFNLRPQIFG